MPVTLEIYFADLIAFVEHQLQNQPKKLWALIPKNNDGHTPKLIYLEDQFEEIEGDLDLEITKIENPRPTQNADGYCAINLNNLGVDLIQNSFNIVKTQQTSRRLPIGDDNEISWITYMKDLDPAGMGQVKQNIFMFPKNYLLSYFTMLNGSLSADHFCSLNSIPWTIHKYKFKNQNHVSRAKPAVMVNCVKATSYFEEDTFEIRIHSFDDTNKNCILKSKSGQSNVKIIIGNLTNIKRGKPKANLNHFLNYYSLVNGYSQGHHYLPKFGLWPFSQKFFVRVNNRWPPPIIKQYNSFVRKLVRSHRLPPGGARLVMQDLESCPLVWLEPPEGT